MKPENRDNLYRSVGEALQRLGHRPLPEAVPIKAVPAVSFEFFPPATDVAAKTLWRSIEALTPLAPRFVSVTYGAAGSTRERTHATVKRIVDDTPLTPAAHLTCVAASRAEVDEVVDSYWDAGVRHLVALRGDPPGGVERYQPHPAGYRHAGELVAGIRRRHDFDVSVAAYPETHPEGRSAQADLDHLKRKLDAGATRAITQFFLDPEIYLRFRDRACAAGIQAPIVPGILPVTNFQKMRKFAASCGASVPAWLAALFGGLDEAPEIRQLVAATVTAELCTRLLDHGVNEFHFYTLNRFELTRAICHILGIRPTVAPAATGGVINA